MVGSTTSETGTLFYPIIATGMICYAKSLQSCPTLCDPIDSSPPGSPVPGILQARTLEWAAISFSNAWKWKVKVKLLSRVLLLATPWTAAHQAPPSMGFFQARVLEWGAIAFSTQVWYYILILTICLELLSYIWDLSYSGWLYYVSLNCKPSAYTNVIGTGMAWDLKVTPQGQEPQGLIFWTQTSKAVCWSRGKL